MGGSLCPLSLRGKHEQKKIAGTRKKTFKRFMPMVIHAAGSKVNDIDL